MQPTNQHKKNNKNKTLARAIIKINLKKLFGGCPSSSFQLKKRKKKSLSFHLLELEEREINGVTLKIKIYVACLYD